MENKAPLDEIDILTIVNELQDKVQVLEKTSEGKPVKKSELEERLSYIEKQLKYIAFAFNSIKTTFDRGIKITVDERTMELTAPLKDTINAFRKEIISLRELRKEIEEQSKSETIVGTIKFMAKTLHKLREHIHSLKENGIKKDIGLSFTLDGYEMVQKKLKEVKVEAKEEEKPFSPKDATRELLDTLLDREGQILIHSYGLFGETPKKLKDIGKMLGITPERAGQLRIKTLRKCAGKVRMELVEKLTFHSKLRDAILNRRVRG